VKTRPISARVLRLAVVAAGLFVFPSGLFAQGLIVPGAGAVNRAMAGASTAAPIDVAGAGYWNAAAISGLEGNQIGFSAELAYADMHVTSEIPRLNRSGRTFSNGGLATLPTIAMVHHLEDSCTTVGLGVYAFTGGAVNFPGDSSNPVLSPNDPPLTRGLGPQYASMGGLLIAPMASRQLTDTLAVGGGPTIMTANVALSPAYFAGRNDANGDGVSNYSGATHGHPTWGGGFRLGSYYRPNCSWAFGLSFQSPQWFESFKYNSQDEVGADVPLELDLTMPWYVSLGSAYTGIDRTLIAMDVRFFDWSSTKTFGERPIDGGTAWQSIFSVALGTQYELTDRLAIRGGYLFNENPIPEPATMFNLQLPLIMQHTLSAGASYQLTEKITMDFAWVHCFENSIEGPILQLPEATVGLESKVDAWLLGLSVTY